MTRATAGLRAYGPEHPDYPNAPADWDDGPYLCRDGKMYHMRGYGWKHGECCWNETADWDRIAYRPKLPEIERLKATPLNQVGGSDE